MKKVREILLQNSGVIVTDMGDAVRLRVDEDDVLFIDKRDLRFLIATYKNNAERYS